MDKPIYQDFKNKVEPKIMMGKVLVVTRFIEDKQEETTVLLCAKELRILADYLESKKKEKD